MINDTKEPSDAHKNTSGRNLSRNHWEFHGEVTICGYQNVQDALKKFQDTKNKEYEKTQKQINELRGAINKHWSETKNTINRDKRIKDENKKY
jgi:hypothetical protein